MRLFVSYASQDRTRAEQLADHLVDLGHQVFIDRDLTTGSQYRARLEAEVAAADRVIVLWTKNSVRSHWVKEEAEAGRSAGKLLPLRFRVPPPFGFREIHTPDLPLLSRGPAMANALGLGDDRGAAEPMRAEAMAPDGASPEDWYGKRGLFGWATRPR